MPNQNQKQSKSTKVVRSTKVVKPQKERRFIKEAWLRQSVSNVLPLALIHFRGRTAYDNQLRAKIEEAKDTFLRQSSYSESIPRKTALEMVTYISNEVKKNEESNKQLDDALASFEKVMKNIIKSFSLPV